MTKEFFQASFLSNTVQSWLIVAAVILFMLLFSHAASKLLAFISVKYFTKVTHKNFQETIALRVVKPLSRYLFWLVTIVSLTRLHYPDAFRFVIFKIGLKDIIEGISVGWLTICFFRLVIGIMLLISAVLKNAAIRRNDRSMMQMIALLTDLFKALLIVICILAVIKFSLKYSLASFVTSLGLVTAALALAAKESVENIICSFIIFLDKPFLTGDYIKIGGVSGTVEKIGLRSTLLRTDSKTIESIPNRQMAGSMLENVSNQTMRRFSQTLEIALSTPSQTLRILTEDILKILQSYTPKGVQGISVFLKETGVNAHKVYMEYFVPIKMSLPDFYALNQAVNLEIIELLHRETIKLAEYLMKPA